MSATATDRRLLALVGVVIAGLAAWGATLVGDTIPPAAATPFVPGLLIGCIGAFLLVRTDARRIGWLLTAQTFFGLQYICSHVYESTGSTWSGVIEALGWNFLTCLGVAIILYPTGRPASRVLAVLVGLAVTTNLLASVHWLGVNVGWWQPISDPAELAVAAAAVPLFLSFFEQARIHRRRPRLEQEQVKWYVFGLVAQPAYVVAGLLGWSDAAFAVVDAVVALLFPLAILVGITRYRLYEIDRFISRTVGYTLVVTLLLGLGVGTLALLTAVLPTGDRVVTAVVTMLVVAVSGPVRRRVLDVVDRRFDRTRYVAQQVVADFGRTVADETDLDALRTRLDEVLRTTLAPATLAVWEPHR